MRVDTHELTVLAGDLDEAGGRLAGKVARVTESSLERIEADAARRVRGHPHLPHLPRSFAHDVDRRPDEVTGEVGAEWARLQGKLDVFIEYGTPTSTGIRHWLPASDHEVPRWINNLEDATGEVFG